MYCRSWVSIRITKYRQFLTTYNKNSKYLQRTTCSNIRKEWMRNDEKGRCQRGHTVYTTLSIIIAIILYNIIIKLYNVLIYLLLIAKISLKLSDLLRNNNKNGLHRPWFSVINIVSTKRDHILIQHAWNPEINFLFDHMDYWWFWSFLDFFVLIHSHLHLLWDGTAALVIDAPVCIQHCLT